MKSTLSPGHQWFKLKYNSILRGKGKVHRGELQWEFEARPTPLSRLYKLRICQRKGCPPKVFVLNPNLTTLAQGKELPHVYSEKPVQLCLYFPNHNEWTLNQFISDTIVPWSYLWLFYFEQWLVTGEWHGGGKHPGERSVTN